jgi:fibronectin-binding autotransporter adhesin
MNSSSPMIRRLLLIAAIAGIQTFCVGATPSFAAPIGNATWTGGGGSGNWSTSSNWSTIPTTSGTWNLVFGGATQTTSTNTIGTVTLGTLSFTNDGSSGNASLFTLSGSTLALSNSSITTTATTGALSATGDTISNALTLSGSNSVTLGGGHSLSLTTGGISGAGSLSVGVSGGDATLFLSGSNTYSGNTSITGGQVRTAANGVADGSNSSAFGTGGVIVSGSGSAVLRNATTLLNNFEIGGSGLSSSGTLGALRGSFSTSSRTASISGTVTLAADATITTAASNGITDSQLTLSGPVVLGSNVLTLAPDLAVTNTTSSPIVLSGGVSGSGSVVVNGQSQSRSLLSGSSSYTGGTRVTSGSLAVGNGNALGTGSLAVDGGVLDLNGQSLSVGTLSGSSGGVVTSAVAGAASLTVNQTANSGFAASIQNGAGVVSLAKSGIGVLHMSGSNSYSGGTTVTEGQVRTAASGAADGSNNYAFGTGDVIVSGSGSAALRNATALSNNFTIGGAGVYGSGTQGAIRGTFSTSNRTASISGAVTLSADALIATAASDSITNTSLLLSGPISLGSHALTFSPHGAPGVLRATDPTASPIVVTGTITGTGDVIVDGPTAVYLNGVNSSTGATTVRAGTLAGNGSIAGAVTVESGAFISPGSAVNTTGALGVGSLQLDSGATANMAISGTGVGLYDQIVAANNVNYGGSLAIDFTTGGFADFDVWQLFSGSSHSGNFSSVSATGAYGNLTFNYLGDGEWQATGGLLATGQSLSFYEDNTHAIGTRYQAGQLVLVPEPSTVVFAGIGLFFAGWRSWSRRRAVSRQRVAMGGDLVVG